MPNRAERHADVALHARFNIDPGISNCTRGALKRKTQGPIGVLPTGHETNALFSHRRRFAYSSSVPSLESSFSIIFSERILVSSNSSDFCQSSIAVRVASPGIPSITPGLNPRDSNAL